MVLPLVLTGLMPREAHARKTSLLLLGRPSQSVSLGYGYDEAASDSGGGSTSSSQHSFNESYDMGFPYAIYHPRLLRGNFRGSVRLDQDMASGALSTAKNSARQNFQYQLSGTLLERMSYPVTFYSYSEFGRVKRAFSPSYDLRSDGVGAALTLGNTYLPVSLSYSQSSSTSSGQGVDTASSGETLSFSAAHSYGELSQSGGNIAFSRSDTSSGGLGLTSSENLLSYGLSNTLSFDRQGLARKISSRYSFLEETGSRAARSSQLKEELLWEAGKALNAGLGYSNHYENNDNQESRGNSGAAWLQHRLFQSLFTRLEGHAQQTDFSTGKITNTGGGISFDYQKELPRESRLQIGYSFTYDVSDNALQSDVLFANNERQVVPTLPPFEMLLKNPDVIHGAPGDIVVSTSDRTSFTYREGVDYTISQKGLLTYIVIPNLPTAGPFPIDKGTVLSIDYRYRVNPSVKSANSAHSAGATLSLFSNRHRIYARVTSTAQELLGGQANAFRLNDTRLYSIGFDTSLEDTNYGASYRKYESSFNKSHDFDGYWRYARYFKDNFLSLNLLDHYSINEAVGFPGGNSTNSFSAASTYQRVLLGRVNMKATGQFTDVRGAISLDEIVLGVDMDTSFGKSMLALSSTLGWRFTAGNVESQESIRLTYTRFF